MFFCPSPPVSCVKFAVTLHNNIQNYAFLSHVVFSGLWEGPVIGIIRTEYVTFQKMQGDGHERGREGKRLKRGHQRDGQPERMES